MSGTYQTKTGMRILREYFNQFDLIKNLEDQNKKPTEEQTKRLTELQMQVVDMARRSPLAVLHAANSGSYKDDLYGTMPYYMTFRKLNDGLIRYDKVELRDRISATHGLSPDKEQNEEGSDTKSEENAEKPKRAQKAKENETEAAKPAGPGRGRKKAAEPEKQPVAAGAAASSGDVNIEDLFSEDE